LTAGCVRRSLRAAREKLRSLATITNTRRSSRVIAHSPERRRPRSVRADSLAMLARRRCDKRHESAVGPRARLWSILSHSSISRNITKLKIITLTSILRGTQTSQMSADGRERANASEPAERSGDRLLVFDTTLRDGEQAPGFSMRVDEKVA